VVDHLPLLKSSLPHQQGCEALTALQLPWLLLLLGHPQPQTSLKQQAGQLPTAAGAPHLLRLSNWGCW
jgi:hypothetical protein